MKKNVVSQLAGQLQQLSQTFRKNQRDYLQSTNINPITHFNLFTKD